MLKKSEMIDPGENSPDISYGTNGQKSACSSETLILEVESMTEDTKALRLKFDNYQSNGQRQSNEN